MRTLDVSITIVGRRTRRRSAYSNATGLVAMIKPRETTWTNLKPELAQFDRLLKDV
jgi:hypothetical protein